MADIYLDVETAISTIEIGLVQTIALAMRKRLPAVADIAALRALATVGASGTSAINAEMVTLRPVTATGAVYQFAGYSMATDDGVNVVKPTDRTGAGRWTLTTSTSTTGVLEAIRLYEGDEDTDSLLTKLFAKTPTVVVRWMGDEDQKPSVTPGALYRLVCDFEIWAISRNYRSDNSAILGSGIASEAAADPGVNRLIGQLKKALAGSDLALSPGVDYVQIYRTRKVIQSLAERRFIHALSIKVFATDHLPDTADQFVTAPDTDALNLQLQLANTDENGAFYIDNLLTGGIAVTVASGLTQTIGAGTARVVGAAVVYAGESHVFAAWSQTYRDLNPDGTLTFVAVPTGTDEPPTTANALRIGVTITSAVDVIDDVIVAPTLSDYGPLDLIPKA